MSNIAEIDDFLWLTSPAAAKSLAKAAEEGQQAGFSPLRLATRLRAELSPSRKRLVLEQVELRRRAAEKFARADSMFFIPVGLEQATDELVAAYKASLFPGNTGVADLCCGIGGDAIALAQRGSMLAIDRNPIAAIFAQANLQANGIGANDELLIANVATIQTLDIPGNGIVAGMLKDVAAWHIDPDRRPAGRRTTRVELHEPGVETIRALLAVNSNAAIKLAPATELIEPWWQEAELEWISRGRQCRQLVAWFGSLARNPGQRRATVIAGHPGETVRVAASIVGQPDEECQFAEKIGRYVYEPDAAVLAAKLDGMLAQRHNLQVFAAGIAYFTADHLVPAGGDLAVFEVLEKMPYDIKRLKAWLAERRIGRLEIKKRGVPLDPEQVRRNLRTDGDESATVLLAKVSEQFTAIIARRVLSETSATAIETPM